MAENRPHTEGQEVRIELGGIVLEGNLTVPDGAQGVVVFAHGSGSSRFSPRNNYVASELRQAPLGTLLFDLLTKQEEASEMATRHLRFDIGLLASRLVAVTDWLADQPTMRGKQIGYFGASTGAGAALVAAAARPKLIGAVVSRGGRPDLAGPALAQVQAPTLLIVGSHDTPVIEMNRSAMSQMHSPVSLQIVEGASHLFAESGTLETAARLARDFLREQIAEST